MHATQQSLGMRFQKWVDRGLSDAYDAYWKPTSGVGRFVAVLRVTFWGSLSVILDRPRPTDS